MCDHWFQPKHSSCNHCSCLCDSDASRQPSCSLGPPAPCELQPPCPYTLPVVQAFAYVHQPPYQ